MTLETSTHRNILLSILKDISSDSIMGSSLGFKGGTAAYLFYDLPRFSVDLDFDLLDKNHEQYVFQNVKEIIEKYGYVKQTRETRCLQCQN
jgi:predicted nucleotidyltransferase component of viral defense system